MPALVLAGIGALALALLIGGFALVAPRRAGVPLSRLVDDAAGPTTRLGGAAEDTTALADRMLQRSGRADALGTALERAGVRRAPSEIVVLTVAAATATGAVGFLIGGAALGLLTAALAPVGARMWIGRLRSRRQLAFIQQLDDSLTLMASSLRAGHSVLRALDAVSRDTPVPTSEEFSRVVNETRVGRDVNSALDGVVDRTKSEDFGWVVQAIAIHREVGGNLAEVLDRVGVTIRERNQMRGQAKSLSAEGRMSAVVLLIMPFVLCGLISVSAPAYLARMTGSTGGLVALGVAGALMITGALWIRSIVRVEF